MNKTPQKLKRSLIFHDDPGHGWLAVKRKLLNQLGILGIISYHSYQKGGTVYLEEDRDAQIFMDTYKKQFGEKPDYRRSQNESCYHKQSCIRNYEPFEAGDY